MPWKNLKSMLSKRPNAMGGILTMANVRHTWEDKMISLKPTIIFERGSFFVSRRILTQEIGCQTEWF
jgi:hypothetical protein